MQCARCAAWAECTPTGCNITNILNTHMILDLLNQELFMHHTCIQTLQLRNINSILHVHQGWCHIIGSGAVMAGSA